MKNGVALVRTDVSEELSASRIRVIRICEISALVPTWTIWRSEIWAHNTNYKKVKYFLKAECRLMERDAVWLL
jgi:hypothetical protein